MQLQSLLTFTGAVCLFIAVLWPAAQTSAASLPSSKATSALTDALESARHTLSRATASPSSLNLDSSWEELAGPSKEQLPLDSSSSQAYRNVEIEIDILRNNLVAERKAAQDPTVRLAVVKRDFALTKLREEIYKDLNIKAKTAGGPVTFPYREHLTPEMFARYVVKPLQHSSKTPWMWVYRNKRYLLAKESLRLPDFVKANNFRPNPFDRLFAAFVEVGDPGSQVFEYLGVFRPPLKVTRAGQTKAFFGEDFYRVGKFRVLSSSTFTTKVE